MQRLPSTTALQMFAAAARDESFARAAERLNVTQAAISKQVKQLEEVLGVSLFQRQHRRVLLTEQGARYLEIADSVLTDLTIGTGAVFDQALRPKLHVEVDVELMTFWLAPKLPALRALLPDVDLRFSPASQPGRRTALEADIAVMFGRSNDPAIQVKPLFDIVAFPVCSPRLRETLPNPMEARDFEGAPLVHDANTNWWDRLLGEVGVKPDPSKPKLFITHTPQLIDAALSGVGLVVGDDMTCRHPLEAGSLVRVGDMTTTGTAPFFTAQSRERPLSTEAETFLNWLHAEAEEQRQWRTEFLARTA